MRKPVSRGGGNGLEERRVPYVTFALARKTFGLRCWGVQMPGLGKRGGKQLRR